MKLFKSDTLLTFLVHVSVAFGLFFLLSFTFFYRVLPVATNKDKIVTVPDVQGMSFYQAKSFLESGELGFEVTDSAYDSKLDPLAVLEQYPHALSKVKINRKVGLTLNARNPPSVLYPDLVGTTFENAKDELARLDLKIGKVQYRPDVAFNTILESSIQEVVIHAGQRVKKGSIINLNIGGKTDEFELPDFVNMPLDEVELYILGINLNVKELHRVQNENAVANTIEKQKPAAGEIVRHGDDVELWVYNLKERE